jgi:hypothetical protein
MTLLRLGFEGDVLGLKQNVAVRVARPLEVYHRPHLVFKAA